MNWPKVPFFVISWPIVFSLLALSAGDQKVTTIPPTLVTLQGQLPLAEAIKRLRTNGNDLVDLRPRLGEETSNPRLDLNLVGVPFWHAVDQLAEKAELRVVPFLQPDSQRAAVGFAAAGDRHRQSGLVSYSGPFRIALRRLATTRTFDGSEGGKLVATIQIAWEPRRQPLLLRQRANELRATLDDGSALPVDAGGTGAIKLLGDHPVEFELRMGTPNHSVKALRELRGAFDALIPPTWLTWNLPKLTSGAAAEEQGVKLTLARFQANERARTWSVALKLEYPPGTLDLESFQTWSMESNEAILVRADDQTTLRTRLNPEISIDEGRCVRITYYFEDAPADPSKWSLRYRAPAAPTKQRVEYRFENVPLP